MDTFIAPLLLLVVLFVGFGLANRGNQKSRGCSGCTETGCDDKTECSVKDNPGRL